MINFNKKGTVILTYYRAGGTLLRDMLVEIASYYTQVDNYGEIDFIEGSYDFDTTVNYKHKIKNVFESFNQGYKIIQLNNPLVISYLFSINYFPKILENFEIIHLERKDFKKSLLSLPLWEELINEGLYDIEHMNKENMLKFHKKLILNPIDHTRIYSGIHFDSPKDENYRNFLDFQIMLFFNKVYFNRNIKNSFNFKTIFYEDFENELSSEFLELFNLAKIDKTLILKAFKDWSKMKIPYVSQDYLVYFTKEVKEVFNYWDL